MACYGRYGPINTISQTLGLIEGGKAGFQRVYEILGVERDLRDGHRTIATGELRGDIMYEDVSFSYEPDQPVLRNMNLHVTPGQTVAIVGRCNQRAVGPSLSDVIKIRFDGRGGLAVPAFGPRLG